MSELSLIEKCRLWSASARVSNLPSVWINVLALPLMLHGVSQKTTLILWLLVISTLLYISGNLLNDWQDRVWDAKHRPERALPRGVFSSSIYAWSGALGLVTAWNLSLVVSSTLAWVVSWVILNIFIYNYFHKKTRLAVIPMALCRGGLILMGDVAFRPNHDGISSSAMMLSIPLMIYVVALTLQGRSHHAKAAWAWGIVATLSPLLLWVTNASSWQGMNGFSKEVFFCILFGISYLCLMLRWRRCGVAHRLALMPMIEAFFAVQALLLHDGAVDSPAFILILCLFAIGLGYGLQRWAVAT